MLKIYEPQDSGLQEISLDALKPGCWLNLINPTPDEVKLFSDKVQIPEELIQAALDEDEPSRIQIEDSTLLIVTSIPIREDIHSFNTLPLGFIINKEYFITVCLEETKVLRDFATRDLKKGTRFLFEIFYKSARLYLEDLRQITQDVNNIETSLKRSMKNKAIFDLLQLQKSLVYFTTALKDNAHTAQKLLRLRKEETIKDILQIDEEDEDLLDDVLVEYRQAIESVEMHSNVLTSMMDAFTSIISNNLNIVMKFLTSMTILLAIPTMIASFWGMNVHVPGIGTPEGFYAVTFGSLSIMVVVAIWLWRKGMF